MALPPPDPQALYWETVVVDLMRIPVRVAVQLGRSSADDLVILLRRAILLELMEGRRLTQARAASYAGITPRTAQSYLKGIALARQRGARAPRIHAALELVRSRGEVEEEEIADAMLAARKHDGRGSYPRGSRGEDEADSDEWDLGWLLDDLVMGGYLSRDRREEEVRYRPGPRLGPSEIRFWDQPLDAAARTRLAAIQIMEHLGVAPGARLPRDQLRLWAGGRFEAGVGPAAVLELKRLGVLLEEGGERPLYRLVEGRLPGGASAGLRLRAELPALCRALASGLGALISERDRVGEFCQRVFEFSGQSDAVDDLFRRHREWFREEVKRVDERTGSLPGARRWSMIWLGGTSDPPSVP